MNVNIIFQLTLIYLLFSFKNCCEFHTKGRHWYVVGNFSEVINCNGTTLQASNIAYYDGTKWKTLGNGTNGRIYSIFIDTCFNLYIGGNFTKASNKNTGPLAVLKYGSLEFEKVHNVTFVETVKRPVVYSISVDCKNIPTSIESCDCDVFIGGSFKIDTYNEKDEKIVAVNIAKFDSFSRKNKKSTLNIYNFGWSALGGEEKHGMNFGSDVVYVVNKKNFGIQISSNLLYFGGNFKGGFMYYNLNNPSDEHVYVVPEILQNREDIIVYDIYYDPLIYSIDKTIFAGNFEFNISIYVNITCKNICIFSHIEGTLENFKPVNHTIYKIRKNIDEIVIGGENTLKKTDIESDDKTWVNLFDSYNSTVDNTFNVTFNVIKDFYLCRNIDVGCNSNSIGFLVENGILYFHDSQEKLFYEFGQNTNGEVEAITSVYDYYGLH